jgi:hypothetical protein
MDISDIKYKLLINAKNIPGRSINRKIVVIECDDWGSIRMPSLTIYNKLLNAGIHVDNHRYNKYDTLEDKEDLEQLFDLLLSVKDNRGNPAVITPITIMANPDFRKIKDSGFTQYYYEKFTETLARYGRHPDVEKLWKKGIELGIFVPELHGREHIAVQLWLQKLNEGGDKIRFAFDNEFVSVEMSGMHPIAREFRAEFYFNSPNQKEFLLKSAKDSVLLFKEFFGYIPRAFVPANAVFHPDFENPLFNEGVRYLNVNHRTDIPAENGRINHKWVGTGKKSPSGLTYYIRNCAFEPTDPGYRGIDFTMKQIEAAFRWGKPANISTHRVNFVGGIDENNRKTGLKELKSLLQLIEKKWPDVEFMSSCDMLKVLYNNG